MELAGKYKNLKQWAETPEATGGQYPTLNQELDRQLNIMRSGQPGSPEVVQAMINISDLQNIIKEITMTVDRQIGAKHSNKLNRYL
jgi:hypothetical protein